MAQETNTRNIIKEKPTEPGLYWIYRSGKWIGAELERGILLNSEPYYQVWIIGYTEAQNRDDFDRWIGPLIKPDD